MIKKASEFNDEYQIFFATATFENSFKALLNKHITI